MTRTADWTEASGTLDFLAGGGGLGELMRAHDWSATPLGEPETWPQSLRSVVQLMLANRQLMFVAWGPELTFLYNDGYAPAFGQRHPSGLGRPFREVWSDIWPAIEPLVMKALGGEATHDENLHLVMERNGYPEDAWFTFSYSPLRDESGAVAGMFCAGVETTKAVLAERQLRESEEFNRRVLASSPDCIKVLDLEGRLDSMSAGGMCVMEVDDFAAIAGAYWPDFWPGDSRAQAIAALEQARSGGSARFQGFAPTAKGSPRWWDVTVTPINGSDDKPEKILSVSRDITAMREAEAALRESGARLRSMADGAPVMIWVTDPTGYCTYRNARWYAFTGQPPRSGEAYGWLDAVHPDDRAAAEQAFVAANAAQRDYRIEFRIRRADGVYRWTLDAAAARFGKDGAYLGYVGSVIDIEERREFETAAQTAAARAEALAAEKAAILGQLAEGVIVTDPAGRITFVNDAAARIHGVARLDVEPDAYSESYDLLTLDSDPYPSHDLPLARAVRGETVTEASWRIRRPDGTQVLAVGSARPVLDAQGEKIGAVLTLRDDTERARTNEELERRVAERTAELEQAQEALRQSQKMEAVGQLTGGIAHDFNNLLTGVIGSLDMMQRRMAKGETDRIERYTTTALTAANRAAALTHRLLAFSRRQPLDPKPVNANRLVTGMEELLRRTIGEGVDLEMVTAGGLWQTLCDPHQLENAVLNLAINARDAMPDGGKLTVETCNAHLDSAYTAKQRDVRPGQYVCICVTDTGTGMAKDVIDRAFEPFFTTKPIGQGTGLGLSMIYGFARQSEGYARIYSEVGRGTTIKLYLPRWYGEAADAEEQRETPADANRAGTGEVVLVVEDETAVRELVVDVLEELGYRAVEAADGPSGLKLLQSPMRVDLLVTDIGLPGLNGRQLADVARRQHPDLKVLFMTGYAENATIANGFLDPGMQMITKPFAIEALATRIRDMIENG